MHRFIVGVAAVLIGSAIGLAGVANSASIGHAGFRSYHGYPGYPGYYWGLYPNTLFGYPNYNSYWGYPYSLYEDDSGCRFEWPKRTVKHKAVQRGVWTCS